MPLRRRESSMLAEVAKFVLFWRFRSARGWLSAFERWIAGGLQSLNLPSSVPCFLTSFLPKELSQRIDACEGFTFHCDFCSLVYERCGS
jgi:hypothetical protein